MQQRGFAFLLRLFILVLAQQSFTLGAGVGDSTAMLKASALAGFLLAPQPALAQESSKPAAPTGLTATAGDGQVSLSWTDPGDSSITKYQVRQKKGNAGWGGWAGIAGSDDETISHTVSGLDNGVEYRFQIRAKNANGNSPVSGARRATPTDSSTPAPTTPLAAPVLTATAGNKSVILSWPDISGEDITEWWYQYKSGGGWGANIAVAANARSVVVGGLSNGTEYTFRMFARAGARQSVWSDQATATPVTTASRSVIISAEKVSVTEGSVGTYRTGSYTVALTAPPTSGTVTVTPASGDISVVMVSAPLTFDTSNYSTPQQVTVTPVKDDDDVEPDPVTVSHTATGGGYGSVSIDDVQVTVTDTTPTLQLLTDPEDVREGSSIRLEVTANRAFSGPLPVRLTLRGRNSSGFDVNDIEGTLGPRMFTVEFGATANTTGTLTIPTRRDVNTDEGNEAYQIRLEADTDNGYALGDDRTADGTINDGPATALTLSTSALTIAEGRSATYTVKLATPTSGTVTVTPTSGDPDAVMISFAADTSLTFTRQNWDTARTVTVTALQDTDSDDETVKVDNAVSGADYDQVTTESLTVTVTDDDETNDTTEQVEEEDQRQAKARKQQLVGLSRTTMGITTDMIGARVGGDISGGGAGGSIGEQASGLMENLLGSSAGSELSSNLTMARLEEHLWHQSFHISQSHTDGTQQEGQATKAQEGRWSLWGAGELRSFQGKEPSNAEDLSYSGSIKAGWLGVDYQFSNPWLAGLALSFSSSTSDYSYRSQGTDGSGHTQTHLTTFYPYGSLQLTDRLMLWGTAGIGFGDLQHHDKDEDTTQEGELKVQLAAIGFEQQLSSIAAWDFALAGDLGIVKSSTQWQDNAGLEDQSVSITRARLGLNSSFPITTNTNGFLNLKGRLDGGDLQMGAAEILLGLRYRTGRFSSLLQGRQTYAFDGSYSESGILGELRFSPQQDSTGLALQLQPSYGAYGQPHPQQAALWDDQQLQNLAGWRGDRQQQDVMALKSTIGYGFRLPDSHLLLTPFVELAFTEASNQQTSLGINMEGQSWQVKLSGSREAGSSTAPNGAVKLMFSKQL